jgi:hypothetical protein
MGMSDSRDEQFFQVGIVVSDLEAAMQQLTAAVGLTWGAPRASEMGPWKYRLAFSHQGPPHVELIEAPAGSPWQPDGPSAMRIDHLQWWSQDLEADTERLLRTGVTVDVDGIGKYNHPFRYFRLPDGLRIELISSAEGLREKYRQLWRID